MKHLRTKLPNFFLISLALATVLSTLPPPVAKAGVVGVGRRTGGIAEIDLVSAVNGSTVVRSLPTQEGAPQGLGATGDSIRILDVTTGLQLGNGNTIVDGHGQDLGGQYTIVLPKPLTTGQRIQALNVTRNFYSSTVIICLRSCH
jgi:hypothetical protein